MEYLRSRVEDLGDGKVILHLSGEIDLSTKPALSEHLQSLAQQGFGEVVIDATDIAFMDSTGFHAFVDGKRLLHERGTRIILVASRPMRQILELLAPDPIFAARVDTLEEARALLDGRPGRSVAEAG